MHYMDIHLRPDPEFPSHQLMGALYAKLHKALAQIQNTAIGVSFPGYTQSPRTVGGTLRLVGPEAELTGLLAHNWLTGMRDHTTLTPVAPVPRDAPHRTLRRVQAKSSPARLRRRQMRRHGLTDTQTLERVPDSAVEVLDLPFVMLRSTSTGQRFPLFLRLGPLVPAPQAGVFNTYGLSHSATVPWF